MALHELAVELFYDGDWHDHAATDEVYTGEADHGQDITISHGSGAETGGITPSTVELTFKSWRFNPDNANSDLYGHIGRNTGLRITVDGDIRFFGEVASWTPRQSLGGDVQVPDRWVEVTAAGQLRRVQTGSDPLPSALRLAYTESDETPVAYWPLDSGQLSTVALPALGAAAFTLGPGQFATADVAAWLEPGVGIKSDVSIGGAVAMSDTPARWTVDHMRRAGTSDVSREMDLFIEGNSEDGSGNRHDWVLEFNPFGDELNFVMLESFPGGQTPDLLDTIAVDVYDDRPHHVRLDLVQDGTGIDWDILIDGISISTGTVASTTLQGVSRVIAVDRAGPAPTPTAFSHIAVWEGDPVPIALAAAAAFGHPGQYAGERFASLSDDAGVFYDMTGDPADTVPMGPQFPGTLAAQYAEIAATDDGIVTDAVDDYAVTYHTGRERYSHGPVLTLDYAAFEVAPPLNPILDDQRVRNDVTATRRDGASSRAVDLDSIDTVGRYTDTRDVNVFSDLVVDSIAAWHLHIGITTGMRFAQVTVDLDATPALAAAVVAVRAGDRIAIVNPPSDLTADPISLVVIGWKERAGPDRRKITFVCIPEAPLHIAEVEHERYAIAGVRASFLFNLSDDGIDALTTTIPIVALEGSWTHEVDYDIMIGGERMTVTAAAAPGGTFGFETQDLTVIRSRNGVVKPHLNSISVQLAYPSYIGL